MRQGKGEEVTEKQKEEITEAFGLFDADNSGAAANRAGRGERSVQG